MKLEIRNLIYSFALAAGDDATPSRTPSQSRNEIARTKYNVPYLGLTQTCTKARAEFRPLWMSRHKVYLPQLNRYISVFLPRPSRKNYNGPAGYFDPAGTLTIQVRASDTDHVMTYDLLPLLKLKISLPRYTIKLEGEHNVPDYGVLGLNYIINNQHPAWLHWIRGNKLAQVRYECNMGRLNIIVVVREKWAEQWMKKLPGYQQPGYQDRGFAGTIGLANLDGLAEWVIRFRVAY